MDKINDFPNGRVAYFRFIDDLVSDCERYRIDLVSLSFAVGIELRTLERIFAKKFICFPFMLFELAYCVYDFKMKNCR